MEEHNRKSLPAGGEDTKLKPAQHLFNIETTDSGTLRERGTWSGHGRRGRALAWLLCRRRSRAELEA